MDGSTALALCPTRRKAGRPKGSLSRLSRARLNLVLVPLLTPQAAKERLELLARWVLEGLITPTQGNTCIRSVEIWLKGELLQQDRHKIAELEAMVARLSQS